MTISDWISFALSLMVFAVLLQKLIVTAMLSQKFKEVPGLDMEELPTVSVLIPARDEAKNLSACLDSLLYLDYPVEKLEILVGDDQSEDTTAAIVKAYAQKYEHIRLLNIETDYHGLVARSNVLAQLAGESENDLLVFLDADMKVDTQWLKEMVAPTAHGYDLVSGYTEVEAKSWLAQFQKFDWISVIMLLKAGADINKPGTALGNNMLVSRKAYDAVGGYEEVGPTFTEDNDLTLRVVKKGFRLFQVVVPGGAKTLPMTTWTDLCKQRNRWMQGAFKQPLILLIPLLFSRLFVLLALVCSLFDPKFGLAIVVFFSFIDVGFSLGMSEKIKKYVPLHIAIFAPVFNSVLDTFTLLSYPWNKQVIWKGRKL